MNIIIIFLISLSLLGFPILVSEFLYNHYPNSKMAKFCRKHIVSDVDMDE